MEYKKPNRKAKRARKKAAVIVDYYMVKRFLKKHPEYKVTAKEVNKIIRQFNRNMVLSVVDNRDGLRLPERLGKLQIVGFPRTKKKIIDFGKSNKTGVVHYYQNWETDNKICKIIYNNKLPGYAFRNCRFWGLETKRSFKEIASKAFKSMYEKYVYVDNKRGL